MEFASSFVINILVVVFLVIDAPKHGKRAWLWGVLGFFLGTIALGIYLIQTDRKVLGWVILIVSVIGYILLIIFILIAIAFLFSL
ncbi:hypothetical protein [Neobacillus niacini]|uniref:hypothetical protein n=1 Tax=Neobacillus niacini TaxID=86668 RepID=UPI0021CB8B99|nr:hypothetical protein [Neobacillus niacini]MCM3763966.1 hypothetical protein [Neobacillus niacini]